MSVGDTEISARAVTLLGEHAEESLVAMAEALLFASGDPLTRARLARALSVTEHQLDHILTQLDCDLRGRGIHLMRQGDQLQLGTAPRFARKVMELWNAEPRGRLSSAALETLAIIVYEQPVTRSRIEAIRGVNCDRAISTLIARDLIVEVGRLDMAGRPMQYGTGLAFLEQFGLQSLQELPRPGCGADATDEISIR